MFKSIDTSYLVLDIILKCVSYTLIVVEFSLVFFLYFFIFANML